MEKSSGYKFESVEIENFKGIKNLVIDIQGRSFMIVGANEAGKSSVLQSLLVAFDKGFLPSEPITVGEKKGETRVVITDGIDTYTVETFFTPGNKKGRIVATNKLGEEIKAPASFFKTLLGDVGFNVFRDFFAAKKEKQVAILKELSGVGREIDKLNLERKVAYDKRTVVNREVDQYNATLDTMKMAEEDIDKYHVAYPKTIEQIEKEIADVQNNPVNTKVKEVKDRVAERTSLINTNNNGITLMSERMTTNLARIKVLQKEVEDLSAINLSIADERTGLIETVKKLEDTNKQAAAWLETNKEVTADSLILEKSTATFHADKYEQVMKLKDMQTKSIAKAQESRKLDQEIKGIDDKVSKLIASSSLPVQDLTFSDDEVLYKGLPFEPGQINTATIETIGAEIAMAMNPKFKVIILENASLLDTAGKKRFIEKCEAKGYMVIMEVVSDDNGGKLETIFTETLV